MDPLLGPPGIINQATGLLHNPDPLIGQLGMLGIRPSGPPVLRGTEISTRFPTAVGRANDPTKVRLQSGDLPAYRASPTYEQNIGLLSEYPGFAHLKGMTPKQAEKAYVEQATQNMLFLHEKSPAVMKEGSPLWYHGASRFTDALAERYGIPKQSASAATAALSPQMDWFKNASLAERVGDTIFSPKASKPMSTEMEAVFPKLGEGFVGSKTAQTLFARIKGKTLEQLQDPLEAALWVRLHDEAHNPRSYRSIAPDGGLGPYVTNKDGSESKVGWGALGEISKAIQAYKSGGDMNVLSPILGNKHKVRNFYMDIQHPTRPDAGITADTHQVAAGQLRPLSGASTAVAQHLGSSPAKGEPGAASSSVTGFQGTYPLLETATANVGKRLGLLGHEAQSSTWEPVRELFSPRFKTAANAAKVDEIWRAKDAGTITLKDAQEAIHKLAGGVGTPSWARPGTRLYDPRAASTYRK